MLVRYVEAAVINVRRIEMHWVACGHLCRYKDVTCWFEGWSLAEISHETEGRDIGSWRWPELIHVLHTLVVCGYGKCGSSRLRLRYLAAYILE